MHDPGFTISQAIQTNFAAALGQSMPKSVVVAHSGGADSTALLHALIAAEIEVCVAHVNHCTREGQSDEDAAWVDSLAEKLNVPYYVKRIDVPALARNSDKSFEEVARIHRYDFLAETAEETGYAGIATGHHADDQAETVLMRIVRGTSPTGLAGIPAIGEWNGIPVYRPLLNISRSEIIEYLEINSFAFIEDASNTDPRYQRNRIRHDLLPTLRDKYNPQIDLALLRLSDLSREDDTLLQDLTSEAYALCIDENYVIERDAFRNVHKSLQRRVLVRFARQIGASSDFDIIDGAADFVVSGGTTTKYDAGNGIALSNGRDTTVVTSPTLSEPIEPVSVNVPGTASFANHTFRFTKMDRLPQGSLREFCTPSKQVVDADALGSRAILRHRAPGDRIRPLGMRGSRKLKDYFSDSGISIEARDQVPIIASESEIVWIVGYAVSDSFAINDDTRHGMLIEVNDAAE